MVAQMVTVGLDLLLLIVVSRHLGPTAAGKLGLATSLWALGAILTAAGGDTLLVKETARSPSHVRDMFVTAALLRLGLGVIVFGAIVAFVGASGYPPDTFVLIILLGFATLVTQMGDLSRAVLQGLEQVRALALGSIFSRAFRTVAVVTLLMLGGDLVQITAVSIGTALIYTLFPLRDVLRRGRVSLTVRIGDAWWIMRSGLPYFAGALFLVGYGQVDVIILSLLASEAELGWYSAAIQFFRALCIVPALAGAVVLPTLARTYARAPKMLPALVGRALSLTVVAAIPISFGVIVLADSAVKVVYGPLFAQSGPVLALIGVVVALTYLNTIAASCLIAMDRQARVTWLVAGALLATIPLDLICIPWSHRAFGNGAIGGAVTFIITEAGVLIALMRALPAGSLGRATAGRWARALLAGAIMAAVIWPLRHAFLLPSIALGAAVYVGLVRGLRLLTPEDWRLLADACRSLLIRRGLQKADLVGAIHPS
jgi:O-antigen/teichoic acid export membrane protein